jgi:hypothetical protein
LPTPYRQADAEHQQILADQEALLRASAHGLSFPFSPLRRPVDWLHHLIADILGNLPPKGRADAR